MMKKCNALMVIAVVVIIICVVLLSKKSSSEGFSLWPSYSRPAVRNWATRGPLHWNKGRGRRTERWRPYGNWSNYIEPNYYPSGYYPYNLSEYYDRYDYTNLPEDEMCFGRIGITDAFGPYTAGVMGKQAWMDWAGRNGFQKMYLPSESVTNDHVIVEYTGVCPRAQQVPPSKKRYQRVNATPQYF